MLRSRQGEFDVHAGRLVSRTLKQSLMEKGVNFATQQAQLASKSKTIGDLRSKTLKPQDVSLDSVLFPKKEFNGN